MYSKTVKAQLYVVGHTVEEIREYVKNDQRKWNCVGHIR